LQNLDKCGTQVEKKIAKVLMLRGRNLRPILRAFQNADLAYARENN
jgi:hypothetical protein